MNVDENGRLTTFRLNGRNDEHVPVGKNTQANRKKWWNKKKLGNRCGNARALRVCFVLFCFSTDWRNRPHRKRKRAKSNHVDFEWAARLHLGNNNNNNNNNNSGSSRKKDKKRKSRRYLRQVRGKAGPLSSLGWRHRKISVNEIKLTSKWAWSVPR